MRTVQCRVVVAQSSGDCSGLAVLQVGGKVEIAWRVCFQPAALQSGRSSRRFRSAQPAQPGCGQAVARQEPAHPPQPAAWSSGDAMLRPRCPARQLPSGPQRCRATPARRRRARPAPRQRPACRRTGCPPAHRLANAPKDGHATGRSAQSDRQSHHRPRRARKGSNCATNRARRPKMMATRHS